MGSWISKNRHLFGDSGLWHKRSLKPYQYNRVPMLKHRNPTPHFSNACKILGGPFIHLPHEYLVNIETVLMVLITFVCVLIVCMATAPNLIPGFKGKTVIAAKRRAIAATCSWYLAATMALFYGFASSADELCLGEKNTLASAVAKTSAVLLSLLMGLFATLMCATVVKELREKEGKGDMEGISLA